MFALNHHHQTTPTIKVDDLIFFRLIFVTRKKMKARVVLWWIVGLIAAEEPANSLQYAEYDLNVYIRNRYVVNTVQVRVENTGSEASEYKFAVDLEKNEFISSLEMTVGNKTRIGEVKEKEEANKIFEKAKQEGKSTAKISKEERLV